MPFSMAVSLAPCLSVIKISVNSLNQRNVFIYVISIY